MNDQITKLLRRSTPAVIVTLPLEGKPSIRIDASCHGDEQRVTDWVREHPDLGEIVMRVANVRGRYGHAA